MKKFFLLFISCTIAFGTILCSCSDDYDDTAIWKEINDLKTQIEKLNSDLAKVQTAVSQLEAGKYVVDYTKTETGCTLVFNDGTSVTIENGDAGQDAPIIGIKESNGIYYWTLTANGVESWLTVPGTSDRIPVSGKDGTTPQISVDAEGYWTVNGVRLLDENNSPIKAAADVSVFSGSEVSADGTTVILTLANGGTIELPMQGRLHIAISAESADFAFGATKTFDLTLTGVEKTTFTKPDGWKVTIDGTVLTVTAPAQENTYADTEGTIAIIGMTGNYSCMAEIKVVALAPAIFYSADSGAWETELPATFSSIAIKTVGGAVVTGDILKSIDTEHSAGYSIDLSNADYESTLFRSYEGSEALLSIVLPRNIEEIPDQGFMNCTAMTSCVMPVGLKKVGDYGNVFSGASALTKVEFPEGVTYLGKMMFYFAPMMGYGSFGAEMALEEVVIPSTVTDWEIGPTTSGSYWFFGCSNLKRIICKLETPHAVSTGSWGDFGGGMGVDPVPSDCVIYVPDGSIAAYKSTDGWSDFTIKGLSEL